MCSAWPVSTHPPVRLSICRLPPCPPAYLSADPPAHLPTRPPARSRFSAHISGCESLLWQLHSQMGSELLPIALSWDLTRLPPGSVKPGSVASSSGSGLVCCWPDLGPPGEGVPGLSGLLQLLWTGAAAGRPVGPVWGRPASPPQAPRWQSLASWQELSYNYLPPLAEIAVTLWIGRWPWCRRGTTAFPGPEHRQDKGSGSPPCPPGFLFQSCAALGKPMDWNQRQSGGGEGGDGVMWGLWEGRGA